MLWIRGSRLQDQLYRVTKWLIWYWIPSCHNAINILLELRSVLKITLLIASLQVSAEISVSCHAADLDVEKSLLSLRTCRGRADRPKLDLHNNTGRGRRQLSIFNVKQKLLALLWRWIGLQIIYGLLVCLLNRHTFFDLLVACDSFSWGKGKWANPFFCKADNWKFSYRYKWGKTLLSWNIL